jgi:hypothetical protein
MLLKQLRTESNYAGFIESFRKLQYVSLLTVESLLQYVHDMMPCTDVIGYSFGGLCCLQLHFTLKMEAAWSSKIMVSYIITQRALT